MGDPNPTVLIIDDDPEFRNSVGRLLRSVGLDTKQFSSVADFLKADLPEGPTCLLLDVRMPGRSGLELQRDLATANRQLPIIFITAHGDIPMTVQAMKGGAIEFLTKPFRDQDLIDAVEAGIARDHARRESDKALNALRERFDTLSPREREIMVEVTTGRLNKQIAHHIGIAEIHGEGAPHEPDAEDEGAFASRAQPNGGYPQADARRAATLLEYPTEFCLVFCARGDLRACRSPSFVLAADWPYSQTC